jgi:uncharacterized protein with PIN domain/sulfur carrier protein ThiS
VFAPGRDSQAELTFAAVAIICQVIWLQPQMNLRFHDALNDFLSPRQRGTTIAHQLTRRTSIKDLIESFGVPHTEVAVIMVNGKPVSFDYLVASNDDVQVHARSAGMDLDSLPRLRADLVDHRFVADANLGRLARYLRLLGFDVLYRNDYSDRDVAVIAQREQRIVLTRDRALLQHRIIDHGYFLRSDQPRTQVAEILHRLNLQHEVRPFTRCMRCNGALENVDKQAVLHQLEQKTAQYYDEFKRCSYCCHVYWRGSHFRRMSALCDELIAGNEDL